MGRKFLSTLKYLALALVACIQIYPFYWMLTIFPEG